MDKETTTKIGSMIVSLALVGLIAVSSVPSAQAAEEISTGENNADGPCIEVYTNPPDVTVDPRNCDPPVATPGPRPIPAA